MARSRYATPEAKAREAQRKREAYAKDPAAARAYAAQKRAIWQARVPKQIRADRLRLHPNLMKTCRSCQQVLPFGQFASDVTRADGLTRACVSCDGKARAARKLKLLRAYWLKVGVDPEICYLCTAPYEHADHVYPVSLGGPDEMWNMLPSCATHNLQKSAKPPAVFFRGLLADNDANRGKVNAALTWYQQHIEPKLVGKVAL